MPATRSLSLQQVADRAGVDIGYIRELIDQGVLAPQQRYGEREVHLVALLHVWEEAGLARTSVLEAVEAGEISLEFLENPAWELPEPLAVSYRELAQERGVPEELLLGIHESMGFAGPDADECARPTDVVFADLARVLLDVGSSEGTIRRLFRIYADNLRRLAIAEADLYHEQFEAAWSGVGQDESDLMRAGTDLGRRMAPLVFASLQAIYDRHRQHIWTQSGIERAEAVLERAGRYRRAAVTPAICMVDLTGYTRLTEEQGDEAAARLATTLADVVDGVARRRGGRPIRWLGDGGLFYFGETAAALLSALEMNEAASAAGLPPTHIGVQAGPVVFRDGDVYGLTVNIAARLADRAEAGEVLTSQHAVEQVDLPDVRFEPVGPVSFQGLPTPLDVWRAVRA